MAKTFATMYANVGTMCGDTSTAFQTIIKVFINDKYRDICSRALHSELIDWDYTITLVSGTATYDFPTSFDFEVFCADITEGFALKRYTEGGWWEERHSAYSAGTIAGSTSTRYMILREASKIRFDPTPNNTHVIAFPYKKIVTDLSATTDTPLINGIDVALEYGATAEAMFYKKQYQKGDYWLQKYENEVNKFLHKIRSYPNQRYQFIPEGRDVVSVKRLTGDASYDSI